MLLASNASPARNPAVPKTFQFGDVAFQYPENWILSDDSLTGDSGKTQLRVSLESPNGALWCLSSHDVAEHEAVESAFAALEEEYGALETYAAPSPGDELAPSLSREAQFLYLDFLIRAQAHAITINHRKLVLLFQAEDHEYEQVEPVFLAIAHSLRKS